MHRFNGGVSLRAVALGKRDTELGTSCRRRVRVAVRECATWVPMCEQLSNSAACKSSL